MNWLNKLERKFGRYAVHNLTTYLIGTYIIGYAIRLFIPDMMIWLYLQPGAILHTGTGVYSARTDLEDRILDSGTAAGQSSGNRHYADALLFSRYYAGEDLGSIPL